MRQLEFRPFHRQLRGMLCRIASTLEAVPDRAEFAMTCCPMQIEGCSQRR